MTRRFPIRSKLAAALALPIIGLLVVAAYQVNEARQTAERAGEQAELATATAGFDSLLDALQTERNITGSYIRGVEPQVDLPVDNIPEARTLTDQALQRFRATIGSKGAAIQDAYRPAFDAIDGQDDEVTGLNDLRTRVDEFTGERSLLIEDPISPETWDGYTAIVELLFEGFTDIALEVDDPELRRGATLIHLSSRQAELVAQIVRELVVAQFSSDAPGLVSTDEITSIAAMRSALSDNSATMQAHAVDPYRDLVEQLFESNQVQRFPEVVDAALETGEIDINQAFEYAISQEEFGYAQFSEAVNTELNTQAASVQAAAERQQWFYTGLVLGAVLLTAVVIYVVSRSITRPLRSLTQQASSMANEQLPEAVQDILETPLGEDVAVPHTDPIEVDSRDEVADVAQALDVVQDSALELAVEQAVLRRNIADSFVNLGRRNQNLLGRQLDFITELEQNETDPDTLANLFRLDHLATRMRRNAESLLVLAGIDPPRKWAAPVQLTDVIRAALGEVEDYQRVTVRAVEPATIVGSAAADLAHLLAELVENALVFSPPDQSVEIRGRAHSPNADLNGGGYTLAVIDSGLGMAPEEITRANRRLAGEESFTIAPSKYLGHYVAGNLAARHNINVTLHTSSDGNGAGITVTVDIPASLLTDQATTEDTAPGAPQLAAEPAQLTLTPDTAVPAAEVPGDGPAALPQSLAPPGPPGQVARTNGGLVKRSPAHLQPDSYGAPQGAQPLYSSAPAAPNRPPSTVSEELLQTLATYTTQLHRRVNPQRPPTPPAGNPLRPFPSSPSAAASGPGAAAGMTGDHSEPPNTTTPTPTTHSSTPQHTSSGLARRVRGAQMPATDPLSLKRADEPHEIDPTNDGDAPKDGADDAIGTGAEVRADEPEQEPPPPDTPSRGDAANRSARDVYDFLSSFSAGVQRGLDEAGRAGHRSPPPEEDQ